MRPDLNPLPTACAVRERLPAPQPLVAAFLVLGVKGRMLNAQPPAQVERGSP